MSKFDIEVKNKLYHIGIPCLTMNLFLHML